MPTPQLHQLTLEFPPSVNNLYVTGKDGRRYLAPRARAYKKTAGWQAKEQGAREPIAGEVGVILDIYPPADGRKHDGDNLQKIVLDSLRGIALEDDALVYRLEWEKFKPTTKPRIEVSIYARAFAAVAVCRPRNLEEGTAAAIVDMLATIKGE